MAIGLSTTMVVLAAIAGLAILYSQKQFTFPGFRGQGNLFLPIVVAGLAVLVLWAFGNYVGGEGNIFAATSNALSFTTRYDGSGFLKSSGYFLGAGILAAAAVATYNLARYGKATM